MARVASRDVARHVSVGLDVDLSVDGVGWRSEFSAVAPMPGEGSHSLVVIGGDESGGSISFSFVGRQETGRLVASGSFQPMFPFKDADCFFDAGGSAFSLWSGHCDLVDRDTVVTFQDYFERIPTQNMAKQAGFVRFLRTWGRTSWQKRGLLRGY